MAYRTTDELEAGLDRVLEAPRDAGVVRLVVRRPGRGRREVLAAGELDTELGLVGDDWVNRLHDDEDGPDRACQVTLMNARLAELISGDPRPDAWAQCGDQLYVDLDLSEENLPAGSRLGIGEAILRISEQPHTGCAQFREWWGPDALRLVNGPRYRVYRLRGANASVLRSGTVRPGDIVRRLAAD